MFSSALLGCTTFEKVGTPQFEERVMGEQQNEVAQEVSSKVEREGGSVQEELGGLLGTDACQDYRLGTSPIALENLELIEPMGKVTGSHVTPVDHQYWYPVSAFVSDNYGPFEIYAPADGTIVHVGYFEDQGDYRVLIEHSCGLSTIFIHITTLTDEVLSRTKMKGEGYLYSRINLPIKEGEVIGWVSRRSFDFSVHDENVMLPGFVVPEHYQVEPWKVHTVDAFDYFKEPLRSQLLEKNLRTVGPFGGKIDYDIDGRLVGNWFKENTDGYGGTAEPYWSGHLSVAFDHIDPTQIRVSIGDFDGESKQFGVKGNGPDPRDIGVEAGMVKYELVQYEYYLGETGRRWDRFTFADNIVSRNNDEFVQGVVLFQLIEDRKLKVEIFPGKEASQVKGFSEAAIIYER